MFNPEINVVKFEVSDIITTSTADWEGEEF